MPRVGHLERGQLVDVGVDGGRERPQAGGALAPVTAAPTAAGRPAPADRVVDGGGIGLVDGAQHLLGGRVDQFLLALIPLLTGFPRSSAPRPPPL